MERLIKYASGGCQDPTELLFSLRKDRQGDKTQVIHMSNQIAPGSSWHKKFVIELFNYCFPPDFHLRQCSKMNAFEQKHMHVCEYAAELLVMFHTIGSSTKHERVEKLWKGLWPELQQALWRENLEPQHSTWKQALWVAERHDIADRTQTDERKPGD